MTYKAEKNILLGITGGIAAYKSAILARRLKEIGCDVRVIMTQSALEFITPLTLQVLSGNPVHTTLLDSNAEAGMGHIELARWADLILIAPASCNSISRIAHGIADDLLSTVILASKAPIWIAPAMNQQMWKAKATQRNLAILQDDGVHVIMPNSGQQACGDVGIGRMAEPEEIIQHLLHNFKTQEEDFFQGKQLSGKRVTITAGPTRESIDPVRYISNHSTGKMGFAIAEACIQAGAEVTLITGPVHLNAPHHVKRIDIQSAQEMLESSLQSVANGCDIFIATAAVADYRIATIAKHKIKKTHDQDINITLTKNPDIVATVAQQPNRPFMVGFAAETQDVEQYAYQKLISKKLDMIACNDVSRKDIGFASDDNAMVIFFSKHYNIPKQELSKAPKTEVAKQLVELIASAIKNRKK